MTTAKEVDCSIYNSMYRYFRNGDRKLFLYADLTPLRGKKGLQSNVIEEILITINDSTNREWNYYYEMNHVNPDERENDYLSYDMKLYPTGIINDWFVELKNEHPDTYEYLNSIWLSDHDQDLLAYTRNIQAGINV